MEKNTEEAKGDEKATVPQESESKVQVVDVDPSGLPEVPSQREDLIDYEKYRLEKCEIESAEIVRLPSKFAKALDKLQHSLRISGKIVETVEKEKKTYEFRPSELIGLVEDENGKLLGFPDSPDSKWGKLKASLNISSIKELIGKSLPMTIKEKNGGKFLGFMY